MLDVSTFIVCPKAGCFDNKSWTKTFFSVSSILDTELKKYKNL